MVLSICLILAQYIYHECFWDQFDIDLIINNGFIINLE